MIARVAALAGAALFCVQAFGATAVYFARGRDSALFDQYDVDGYSLQAFPERAGVRLVVKAQAETAESRDLSSVGSRAPNLIPSAERDRVARSLSSGAALQEEAARAILGWVRREITYDADRTRAQDPAAVFASRRAYCVGFAELAVDLLRRSGIAAETVQGVLVSAPSVPGYAPELSGVYHRWVRIFYRDRGWRFADPMAGDGAISARYVPFARRSWTRPGDLRLEVVREEAR
jgi:transglutaminase-like putative cysteine protease